MRKYKKFVVIEGVRDSVNPRGKKCFGNLLTVLEREREREREGWA